MGAMSKTVHVIGATGRSGQAVCRALIARGDTPVPVVRDATKWAATGLPGTPRIADLTDAPALAAALSGATDVVSCAHARHAAAILAAAPDAEKSSYSAAPDATRAGPTITETASSSGRPRCCAPAAPA